MQETLEKVEKKEEELEKKAKSSKTPAEKAFDDVQRKRVRRHNFKLHLCQYTPFFRAVNFANLPKINFADLIFANLCHLPSCTVLNNI